MGDTSLEDISIKPPYGSISAFKNFLDLLDRITVDKVTKEFVRNYKLTSGKNEYKLIKGLQFLGLIDDNGDATEKLRELQLEGKLEENLNKVIREAYKEIFEKVNLEKASKETIINSLMTYYQMRKGTAREGTRIFAYLCQRAGIPLSDELQAEGKPRERISKRKTTKQPRVSKEGKPPKALEIDLEGMHEIRLGNDIIIYLRKGDKEFRKKLAERVKTLIDFYVEGL